ncbi:KDO2-lipid IV(A) lauroyltransferase [Parabacteroides sp. PF5-5]|uniref:lysophospholipid acyltransferase family protein n=1 Tax=unclassified Parabacteroides TaxID=2649774 RepID=UPI002475374B|nr:MULTISPECIES: lysophospholipid acyltransferase family protein [unclassified Parabacteroides]MDH6306633.1 KDO2-lipid IV(A) lauroyltransferase [Parabacteroides sp. PH5-39]MDH6317600.1 KDO2-lipid IV(A) lauroyltransferase [Parabacteroides sp. PF5-13]MDH6321344.1 KDO2-lipid IV(A) lauroyltransferase [Parabacteroides sp. PH5-13]MDH6325091.1 KDO2-lipid IV(A) lauroyltransferase [Parabacteroides sp. PH5-8]MDH6328800.1 KDO2-lipid IV(A) lauroyltransferase [Parabacteroides sp. PH5-41]
MWNKIAYALLYGWVKLHAILPMRLLYVLSDVLYILVYKVVGYRLRVVRRSMKASFPEKTDSELRRMEREFYHHFCDYIVETIKLAHISEEEVLKRAHLKNPEVIDRLSEGEHSCVILYMGHYGNWEWFTSVNVLFKHTQQYQIYRPLKSEAFDRLFIYLRTRFGARGIKKNNTGREIVRLEKNKEKSAVLFMSDQTPSKVNIHYWTSFLNQDTPFFTGAERIARKLDLPVVFVDIRKLKRGYYEVEMIPMVESAKDTPEFWLTEQYARMMEECIMRNPAYWLWTHKRWKYKRESV